MDNWPLPGDISPILWINKERSKKMSPGPCGEVWSQLEISHVTSDGVRAPGVRFWSTQGPGNRFRRKDLRAGDEVPRSRSAEQSADAGKVELARPLHLIHGGASSLWVGLRGGVDRDAES